MADGGERRRELRRVTRRRFLKTAGATLAVGAASGFGGIPSFLRGGSAFAQQRFSGKTIRILTWTDFTGRSVVENVAKTFEASTGAKVIADLTGSTSEMVAKLKASQARPQYDVVFLAEVGAVGLAQAGLLQKPDLSKIPNLSQVVPFVRTPAGGYAIGYFIHASGVVHNTKVFRSAPTTWEVLWDKKYSGKLFLPHGTWGDAMSTTIMAARLAGGDERNIEPGWKKLAQLKGRVLILGSNPTQVAELFRSNSLHVGGSYGPTFLYEFLEKGYPIGSALTTTKEGFFYEPQVMVIPKDHPGDDEAAHALVNHAIDARVQGKAVWWAPVNRNVVLPESVKSNPILMPPSYVEKKGINIPVDYLATVRGEWVKRYSEIFGS